MLQSETGFYYTSGERKANSPESSNAFFVFAVCYVELGVPVRDWLLLNLRRAAEGDDPTFMNMLGQGLRAYENSTWGGWGGRTISQREQNVFAMPSSDTSQQAMAAALSKVTEQLHKMADGYPDFFPAAQRDFAARLKWCVTPTYAGANHAPVVTIEGPLNVLANPGETIRLNSTVTDPDGDTFSIKWWQFNVGTYLGNITITNGNTAQAKITVPKDAVAGQTIHVILEVTDSGVPAMTAYQRVVVAVR